MADNDFPVPQQGAEQSTALATASGAETESGSTEVAALQRQRDGSSSGYSCFFSNLRCSYYFCSDVLYLKQ